MKISEILKRAFITRKCIFCKDPIDYDKKVPICDECAPEWLANLDMMCVKCGYDCEYCNCLPEKVREIKDSFATAVFFYTPNHMTPVNRIVYKLKRNYNLEVIRFCAEEMRKKAIKLCIANYINYRSFVVTYPPRRKKSVVKYGYDHAQLLAKEFAKRIGLKLIPCFKNTGVKEQKTLSKNDRLLNAIKSFEPIDNIDVKDRNVFLIDDVMTSGATLNACARILLENGAKSVVFVTFAKDTKTNTNSFID